MRITEINEPMMIVGSGLDRSPGLHVTQIIQDLGDKLNVVNKRQGITEQELNQFGEIGFMWEDLLAHVLGERMQSERPGEVELDGIVGSPDGVFLLNNELWVEEYKATWLSVSRGIENNWKYMTQVKAYCKMVGATKCRFKVLWINGDYKPPTPQWRQYDVEFTQQELNENWTMLVNHARYRGWL